MRKTELTQEQRAEKYNCSGFCYGGVGYDEDGESIQYPICGAVDICEETKHIEFIASLIAAMLIVVGIPLIFLAFLCLTLYII